MTEIVFLDFEFNRVVEKNVNLVSCATYTPGRNEKMVWWLHNSPKRQSELRKYLMQFDIVVGYACVAEARSFLSLGLDPLEFQWVDLFLEYRMMTNHNDKLQWGHQLVDGRVKFFKKPKPKWERSEEDAASGFKATHSLAEATFKLTGEIRDTIEKDRMRKLIISDPEEFSATQIKDILHYNLDDVIFLPNIWQRLKEEFKSLAPEDDMQEYFQEAMTRGRYSALTAIMESRGYPIDVEATRNFSRQIPHILMECQRDINDQFLDPNLDYAKAAAVAKKMKRAFEPFIPFKWNRATAKYSWNQKVARNWLTENVDTSRWMKTETGKLSLALEAWERHFAFKHDYPRGNFGAQMVRFLKLKQSLYGFSETGGNRKNFWESVGSDGRVRPYMNIFGAQSGRSQPAASGFMFLKPAWMRALVKPKPGYFIAGIDYGQQEFFLSALESECPNMIAAYLSGDPYLYGAKLAGAIPKDGTREQYKIERDLFKNTYLGILYGMTKYGLSTKLTNDTGRVYTEEDAQDQIDTFEDSFPEYMEWKQELMDAYEDGCGIRLPCVAKGTLVLTNNGAKTIESVNTDDLVWDGVEWQRHGGVVHRGTKDVIRDDSVGVAATPDHLVLVDGQWRAWAEVANTRALLSTRCSPDGRSLAAKPKLNLGDMSFVAAYVELKKTLELNDCNLEPLKPVLLALNLFAPKEKSSPEVLAKFLMTSIFGDAGKLAITMQREDVKTRFVLIGETMAVAAYNLASTPFKHSWNTLLHWMGVTTGAKRWTELTTADITKLEIYESSLNQLTTETSDVYDIINCGPRNRFQAGTLVVHNCGWRMWCDNDNLRSVCNVPIQGFGASIMRKAVDIATRNGCAVIFTLHDAIYIEGKVGDEKKILTLYKAMRDAFQFYYRGTKHFETAGKIKLDPFAWSPDYEKDSELHIGFDGFDPIICPSSNLYIDERATSEYERFSKYFNQPETDLL